MKGESSLRAASFVPMQSPHTLLAVDVVVITTVQALHANSQNCSLFHSRVQQRNPFGRVIARSARAPVKIAWSEMVNKWIWGQTWSIDRLFWLFTDWLFWRLVTNQSLAGALSIGAEWIAGRLADFRWIAQRSLLGEVTCSECENTNTFKFNSKQRPDRTLLFVLFGTICAGGCSQTGSLPLSLLYTLSLSLSLELPLYIYKHSLILHTSSLYLKHTHTHTHHRIAQWSPSLVLTRETCSSLVAWERVRMVIKLSPVVGQPLWTCGKFFGCGLPMSGPLGQPASSDALSGNCVQKF